VALGEFELRGEELLFGLGLVVETDLADAQARVLLAVARQDVEHGLVDAVVVRLARVEPHRAEVVDAELLGAVRSQPISVSK
jgi:hypothetical protein